MNINEHASGDINTHRVSKKTPYTRLTLNAIPKVKKPFFAENLQKWMPLYLLIIELYIKTHKNIPYWYTLRATYKQEEKEYIYLVINSVKAYCTTIKTVKKVSNKRKITEKNHFQNIFFARGTGEKIKSFIYGNVNFPYLSFYYCHIHVESQIVKEPLIVQNCRIESLKIICAPKVEDIILMPYDVHKSKINQTVQAINGIFINSVIGKVDCCYGQQFITIIIYGQLSVAFAYVSSTFLDY